MPARLARRSLKALQDAAVRGRDPAGAGAKGEGDESEITGLQDPEGAVPGRQDSERGREVVGAQRDAFEQVVEEYSSTD